ncbi:MAG: hypothetical protein JRJ26_14445 [Deltaproteobacteria bacterium]|nr:hypothetical protein [Deltaproteobacteria bacterium]
MNSPPSPPIRDESGNYKQDVRRFVRTIKELEQEGIRAIVASCGFFALLQKVAVTEVRVPVFTSPLMLIPLLHRMICPDQSIGVITASAKKLTRAYLEAAGVDESIPIAVAGLDDSKEFNEVLMPGRRDVLDTDILRNDVVTAARGPAERHPDIGVVLLECSDLPPCALVSKTLWSYPYPTLSVFINAIHQALVQKRYTGIM